MIANFVLVRWLRLYHLDITSIKVKKRYDAAPKKVIILEQNKKRTII